MALKAPLKIITERLYRERLIKLYGKRYCNGVAQAIIKSLEDKGWYLKHTSSEQDTNTIKLQNRIKELEGYIKQSDVLFSRAHKHLEGGIQILSQGK